MAFSLRKLIGGVAPLLATAVGGPIAGGIVGKLLKEATGTDRIEEAEKILKADPAKFLLFQEKLMDAEVEAQRIGGENLRGLDTGAEFSFWKGLCGSPRRLGVTIFSVVLGFLIFVGGLRAMFGVSVAENPEDFFLILKAGGGTLVLLTGAYVSKGIFGKG